MATEAGRLSTPRLEVASCDQAALRCERITDRWAAWLADDHVQRCVPASVKDTEMLDILKWRLATFNKTRDSLNEELDKVFRGDDQSVVHVICLRRDLECEHAELVELVLYLERKLAAYERTKLRVAFAMCMHARLGDESRLGKLPEDVLKRISCSL